VKVEGLTMHWRHQMHRAFLQQCSGFGDAGSFTMAAPIAPAINLSGYLT